MSVNMNVSWNSAGPLNYSRGSRRTEMGLAGARSQRGLAIRRDSVQSTGPSREVKAYRARRPIWRCRGMDRNRAWPQRCSLVQFRSHVSFDGRRQEPASGSQWTETTSTFAMHLQSDDRFRRSIS